MFWRNLFSRQELRPPLFLEKGFFFPKNTFWETDLSSAGTGKNCALPIRAFPDFFSKSLTAMSPQVPAYPRIASIETADHASKSRSEAKTNNQERFKSKSPAVGAVKQQSLLAILDMDLHMLHELLSAELAPTDAACKLILINHKLGVPGHACFKLSNPLCAMRITGALLFKGLESVEASRASSTSLALQSQCTTNLQCNNHVPILLPCGHWDRRSIFGSTSSRAIIVCSPASIVPALSTRILGGQLLHPRNLRLLRDHKEVDN